MSDLLVLRDQMRAFTAERDWGKYHDPKSLLLALVGEVGELSELFQWLPAEESQSLASSDPLHTRVAEEIADVLLYLVRLADVVGVDLAQSALAKLNESKERFAVEKYSGIAPEKT